MSRSTKLLKEIFTGVTLVAITEIKKHPEGIFIRFSSGDNKHFDKIYDHTSKEFLKMCGAAGTITDNSVFAVTDIGKRLWICVKEVWQDENTVNFYIFDTFPYYDHSPNAPIVDEKLFIEKDYQWTKLNAPITNPTEKAKIISMAKEMIKKVEAKKVDNDDFDIM